MDVMCICLSVIAYVFTWKFVAVPETSVKLWRTFGSVQHDATCKTREARQFMITAFQRGHV